MPIAEMQLRNGAGALKSYEKALALLQKAVATASRLRHGPLRVGLGAI